MKVAILTANLGGFDDPVDPIPQDIEGDVVFHRFTDENFPPITGLTLRLQYRLPKMWGWQMFPGYDYYVWLDGSVSFTKPGGLQWMLDQLTGDMGFFKHPWRSTMLEETAFIDERLKTGDKYLTPRYANGLHLEQFNDCMQNPDYVDDKLYASTAFIYRDNEHVRNALRTWWLHTSRYFTCDQIALPYVLWEQGISVDELGNNPFKSEFINLVSEH